MCWCAVACSSGQPNVVDNFRFSAADVASLQDFVFGESGVSCSSSKRVQPLAPSADEQKLIQAKGQTFNTDSSPLPWWGWRLCQNRDGFACTVVGVISGEVENQYPAQVFVITLITLKPVCLYGLLATLTPRPWPLLENAAPGPVDPFVCHHFYRVSEAAHIDVSKAPFTDLDQLVVFEGVRHVSAGVLLTSPPTALEDFTCMWYQQSSGRHASEPSSARAKPPSLSAAVLARLLEDYPWLQESDVLRIMDRRGSSGSAHESAASSGPMRLSEEELLDDAVVAVEEALAAKRLEWAFDETFEEYFYVFLAGGNWTKKFRGVVADSAQCKSRAIARDFCYYFAWPSSTTFTFSVYGETAANALAREWFGSPIIICQSG